MQVGGDSHLAKFVVLCSARTGSTLLVDYLNLSPDISCYFELLNTEMSQFSIAEESTDDPELTELRNRNVDEFVETMFTRNTTPHFGFKVFRWHNREYTDNLARSRIWKKVVLYRQNILAVYSSMLISQAKGAWSARSRHMAGSAGVSDRGVWDEKVEFVREDFEKFAQGFNWPYRVWLKILTETGQPFIFLDYTQIRSLPMIASICSFIGAPVPNALQSMQVKVNSSVVTDRFSNAEAAVAYLAEIGRLDWQAESFLDFGT